MDLPLHLIENALSAGRTALLESEGLELVAAAGIAVPARVRLPLGTPVTEELLGRLPGERVVLKVESPVILHKSDLGGVRVLPRTVAAVSAVMQELEQRLAGHQLAGFGLYEFMPFSQGIGGELLVGIRRTPEFGPVVVLGPGGIHSEALAGMLKGSAPAVFHPSTCGPESLAKRLDETPFTRFLVTPQRGQAPLVDRNLLVDTVARFLELARALEPTRVGDLEVNPFVLSGGRLVALDALVTLGGPRMPAPAPRPLHKLRCLLQPESVAVIGVSQAMNPGRIIVENLKTLGFPQERITILKEGTDRLAGCRCVPSLSALERPVDLLVCSISADQVPALVEEAANTGKAQSLVLIPGGMEEKEGAAPALVRMHEALAASRRTPDGGPVLNGANCVGFRSLPGKVDTLFIPDHKLPAPVAPGAPIALVSQSGAFLVAALDRLGSQSPRYALSIGNQTDLTAADYLEYLADQPGLELVAVYMEGFKPGDGSRFLQAVARNRAAGRQVLLYMAGRTAAGARASASHTASVAGDHFVIQSLARQAGAQVSLSLEEFGDLIRLHSLLAGRSRRGNRLAAVSNAGFECVAVADNLGGLDPAEFAPDTNATLQDLLVQARVDRIVDLHNPLDLTPMAGDTVFGQVVETLAGAPEVELLVVGCVPMTPALSTLPPGAGHSEDLAAEGKVADRLARVFQTCGRPMVVAIEGGAGYHALRRRLEEEGVPVTDGIEKATRLLALWHGGC